MIEYYFEKQKFSAIFSACEPISSSVVETQLYNHNGFTKLYVEYKFKTIDDVRRNIKFSLDFPCVVAEFISNHNVIYSTQVFPKCRCCAALGLTYQLST